MPAGKDASCQECKLALSCMCCPSMQAAEEEERHSQGRSRASGRAARSRQVTEQEFESPASMFSAVTLS